MSTERLSGKPLSEHLEDTKLFSSALNPRGGLDNELELAKDCPPAFRASNNPWTEYVGKFCFHGPGRAEWKWKSDDPAVREKQLEHFEAILNSRQLRQSVTMMIAAWMLSRMLTEAPVYVP